ncbi:hypothetical protein Dimus_009244 [Dionaea muscipula]
MMEGDDDVGVLLELAATDDVSRFKRAVEEEGHDMDELGMWYGRRIGCKKKMGFEERTPLMIAAMFGSRDVVSYILGSGRVDVNRACGSDGAAALHCAAAGGSRTCDEVVKLLVDASADINCVDASGNRPCDVIAPCLNPSSKLRTKALEVLLKGGVVGAIDQTCVESHSGEEEFDDLNIIRGGGGKQEEEEGGVLVPRGGEAAAAAVPEKKEYPVDPWLPDIKNGIYGTDEFRMYSFKVKPCSRAYSHDWTECPFVHPGENARRRDPRKYHYSCVPCPEFRKGSCSKGDACEYAHGIFECWLHPAQYRTRLCKDETNCSRRVCFFAHKPEELRPLYASTGSAMPSPRSAAVASSFDMPPSITPLALGSPSTPPLTPNSTTTVSSPMAGGAMWQNHLLSMTPPPPNLQLPGSRLKSGLSARDVVVGMDSELLGLENQRWRQRQQLLEEMAAELSSPSSNSSCWSRSSSFTTGTAAAAAAFGSSGDHRAGDLGVLKPANLDDVFGSVDPVLLSQLQGLSFDGAATAQLNSPTGNMQARQRQNMSHHHQQLLSSYTSDSGLSLSPMRGGSGFSPSSMILRPSLSSFGVDPSGSPSAAAGLLSSRSAAAFAKQRSQSFIDRSAMNRLSLSGGTNTTMPCRHLSDWGSPDGKEVDWCIQGEELNKLRKSASFRMRSGASSSIAASSVKSKQQLGFEEQRLRQYQLNNRGSEGIPFPSWVEQQLYMEQEQTVA